MSFWESSFLWRDALIVSVLAAAVLGYLGIWIVLKRVVYVPLALSGVSSLGVGVAALLCGVLGAGDAQHAVGHGAGEGLLFLLDPAVFSLVCALAAAFYFAARPQHGDHAVVVAYLVSSAAVLLLGTFVRQDLHDLQSILFGNAVLVETHQILLVGGAALVTGVIHWLFYRPFLFVSFDAPTAGAAGFATFRTEALLYVTFALMISVATRALGALPAFGLAVLPALTALRFARSLRGAAVVAVPLGVACAACGYYLSFVLELPTGASMVGLAGVIYLISLGIPRRI